MPLDFPSTPSLNDLYTFGGKTWKWDGAGWISYNIGLTGPQGPQGIQGPTGPTGAAGVISGNYVASLNGCTGILGITGTVNEIEITNSCPNITIGLPDNVTISGNLIVLGDLNIDGGTY